MKQLHLLALLAAAVMASCSAPPETVARASAATPKRGNGIVFGPYLQNPTTNGITVCWVSETPTTGTVSYCAGAKPEGDGPGPAPNWKTVKESSAATYHKVRLSGLRPYTDYSYAVECESRTADGFFRTAAPRKQPFKFAAYGDCRSQPLIHAEVLERIRAFKPDFVIQSGDLVANGENELQWAEFWATVAPLVRDVPYYPSLGNHERNGAPYFNYFEVHREYSFDYGNAHFVALDSNRPEAEYGAQLEWLKNDLAAHQDSTWRIVFFHHTPYTCVDKPDRRIQSVRLRERLEPAFRSAKVQLVINGHDHDYQRHEANGITYVVTGGGGAPLYDVRMDTPFTKAARRAHHYCELVVLGDALSVRAVEKDGALIDSFELHAKK